MSGGNRRGARARCRASIHGTKMNWMKANGSNTKMNTDPDSRTATENTRPRSDSKVMSPNPRVDMVTTVQ